MQERLFTLTAPDGHRIFAAEWLPSGRPVRCVLHIQHGMAEHCLRYRHFAEFLASLGVAVYAQDHRGHGQSVAAGETLGYYADRDGWNLVLQDVRQLNRMASELHPGVPVVMFGHSMGSFIARAYAQRWGASLSGLIVSATGWRFGAIARAMGAVARWDARRIGARTPSKLMAALAMGSFNLQFFPARTKSDWLSRDKREVDAYVADRLCGYDCSAGLWADLFDGIVEFERQEAAGSPAVPRRLPALLIAGTRDPVSMGGRGIKQLAERYRSAGLTDVEVKLYKGGRHELLNETNRLEVYADLGRWLEQHVLQAAARPASVTATMPAC
jgi:alpha-beta hydrolase superfamily lysophospholipase